MQFRTTGHILCNKQYNVKFLNDVNSKKNKRERDKEEVEEKWGGGGGWVGGGGSHLYRHRKGKKDIFENIFQNK